jgi:hypothetical protein
LAPSVIITENGRSGRAQYREDARTIDGYFEFGGGDVVAIVSMGSREDWRRSHAWAMDRRAVILQFVADEVVRQRAPACTAEIDEQSGDILLRQAAAQSSPAPLPTAEGRAARFVHRFRDVKAMFGMGVLVVALLIGGLVWLGKTTLSVASAGGVPLNESVRFESEVGGRPGGIASLIQTTDPHLPRWSGRGGNETTSISILLIPLDGSTPRLVPVVGRLTPSSYSLARIMGSDGHTLWFDATGLYGVRLSDYRLVTPRDLRAANPRLDASWWDDPRGMDIIDGRLHIVRTDRSAALTIEPATWAASPTPPKASNARFERHAPGDYLAAGYLPAPDTWVGLHSSREIAGRFRPGKWVRPVEGADDAKDMRRLYRGDLERGSDSARHRIAAMAPLGDMEFLNAAFLRMDDKSEPLQLKTPDGALLIHTSAPGLSGTVVVSRVTHGGDILWRADTGLDRFRLQQILPGAEVSAFVGSRPPIPDKLSEPLVVLVDNKSGKTTSHSLWR